MPRQYRITNAEQLNKLMELPLASLLEEVGKDTVKKLKVFTKQYWYDKYLPEDYKRTYSFLESASYEITGRGGSMKLAVYFDLNKLIYKVDENGWGAHVGFDGEDFTEGMIRFIEDGKFYSSGRIGSPCNPRAGKKGAGMIEKTSKWLERYLDTEIKKKIKFYYGNK